jgi:hypothetical protein
MRARAATTAALALAGVLALAGCGGTGERLPVLTALDLARLADRVAAGRSCGGPLVAAVVAAVNRHEVPDALQERLVSDANRIAATCSRAAATAFAAELRP